MAAASGIAVGSGMSPRARQIVAASGLAGYRPRGERLRQKKILRTRTGTPFTVIAVPICGQCLSKSAGTGRLQVRCASAVGGCRSRGDPGATYFLADTRTEAPKS
jgi:hypothetical protein